jgi:hypothetical protein
MWSNYTGILSRLAIKARNFKLYRRFDFAISNPDHLEVPKSMAEFKAQLGEQLRAGKSSSTKSTYLQIMPSVPRAKSHDPEQVVGSTTTYPCSVCGRSGHQTHLCRVIPQEDRDTIIKILNRCQKKYEASRKQDGTAQKVPQAKSSKGAHANGKKVSSSGKFSDSDGG